MVTVPNRLPAATCLGLDFGAEQRLWSAWYLSRLLLGTRKTQMNDWIRRGREMSVIGAALCSPLTLLNHESASCV